MLVSNGRGCIACLLSFLVGISFFRPCFAFAPLHTSNPSCKIWTSPRSCTNEYAGFSLTRRRQSINQHFFANAVLFGKKQDDWTQASSIFRYLQRSSDGTKGAFEAGVETALVLGNPQQRTRWKKDISERFSWIPPSMLSGCVDGLASAFAAIAPKDLQKALKPGGLEKVRSKIEADFVNNLRAQPIIRKLPIPNDEKKKLMEYLVDLSLDFFLKDLEPILAAPSVKLQALDRERREILNRMSFQQRVWYRLRYKPKATIALGLFSLWTVFVTLSFVKPNQNVDLKVKLLFSFVSGAFLQFITTIRSIVVKVKGINSM